MFAHDAERAACVPAPVNPHAFNPRATWPYGLQQEHVCQAMMDFVDFLGFLNAQLHAKALPRLESFLMPANFSSIVGEFMVMRIAAHCPSLVKNRHHNGHPDLLPSGVFPNDTAQYAHTGIEVKASRRAGGWQGHNPEAVWLMVFHFAANAARDAGRGVPPMSFRFRAVYLARLERTDWNFSGRSATSRRTITASVNRHGMAKLRANWLYREP